MAIIITIWPGAARSGAARYTYNYADEVTYRYTPPAIRLMPSSNLLVSTMILMDAVHSIAKVSQRQPFVAVRVITLKPH